MRLEYLSSSEYAKYTLRVSLDPSSSTQNANDNEAPATGDLDADSDYNVMLSSKARVDVHTSLISLIKSSSAVPVPSILKTDHTKVLIDSSYSLISSPLGLSLSSWSSQSSKDNAENPSTDPKHISIDVLLGSSLRQLHSLENDWFGPVHDPAEWKECISWQECFTLLLEEEIDKAIDAGISIPGGGAETLRAYLSRAIGFYLFDDVEVPSLVWCTKLEGWKDQVFITDPQAHDSQITISAFTGFENGHAIWGDPLMDDIFRSPDGPISSPVFVEAYEGSPFVLPRHQTKRLWYTVYAALVSFVQLRRSGNGDQDMMDKERILVEILAEAIVGIKKAMGTK